MSKYHDHAGEIVAKLVAEITNGVGEWSAPWHHDGGNAWQIRNAVTDNPYTAGNYINLAISSLLSDWGGDWATYKQWASQDAQVRKGEHGTRLLRWVEAKRKDSDRKPAADPDGAEDAALMFPVYFTVFNRSQVDGLEPLAVGEGFDPIAEAEVLLAASGVTIVHTGDRAFYRPAADVIQLPDRARFSSLAAYYSTALHELVHSTARQDRCDRVSGRHGTPEYAIEELTAELGAAMLTGRIGLANEARQDHAAYLASWLDLLGKDPTHLFIAAGEAQKAVDYITNTTEQSTQARTEAA